ncbi:MAG: calcium-binding protein [Methylococcales bacterium]|nr:calcium-binding protein [Methylococcales bacterium]
MATKIDLNNDKIKKILPTTDVEWVDKNTISKTDNAKHSNANWLKQSSGDTVDASAKTSSEIDYSKSIFDNDLIGSLLGKNKITGGSGSDIINGGSADDSLVGGEGSDNILGGGGNDLIIGGAGDDVLSGEAGNNKLTGGLGIDTFIIKGTDVITDLGSGSTPTDGETLEVLSEANVTATITANWYAGFSTVNEGTATLNSKNFSVNLTNASGANGFTIDASKSSKAVTLTGSLNNDTISGGAGNDTINARKGDDIIHGGKGNDTIDGGAGNDTIYGGTGKNSLTGGEGADTFVYLKGDGVSTITDFATGDKLQISVTAFKGLTVGAISESSFISNATGLSDSADHKFIFNTTNGNLYYDADGSATKSKPVLIETLGVDSHPALTGSDISIIA